MTTNPKTPIATASPIGATPTVDTRGDDPMTAEQAAILRNLCERTGARMDDALNRRQAEARIKALRDQAGSD